MAASHGPGARRDRRRAGDRRGHGRWPGRSSRSPGRSTSRPSATTRTPRSGSRGAPAGSATSPRPTARPTSAAGDRSWARCRARWSPRRSACSTPRSSCRRSPPGWARTDARHDLRGPHRRRRSASSRRILGDEPDGRRPGRRAAGTGRRAAASRGPAAVRAGCASLGLPGEPLADAWRLADLLREYRGDAHSVGVDRRRVRRHRDRPAHRAVLGPADAHLRPDPGVDATTSSTPPRPGSSTAGCCRTARFTAEGRAEREAVEVATDRAVPADRRRARRRPRRAARHPRAVG